MTDRQASIERAREAMRAPGGYYRVDPVGWEHVSWSKKFPADIRALANVVLELAAALADAERQRDEADARLAHSERLHTQWFIEAHELSRKLTAAEAALAAGDDE